MDNNPILKLLFRNVESTQMIRAKSSSKDKLQLQTNEHNNRNTIPIVKVPVTNVQLSMIQDTFIQIDTGNTRIMHLLEKLLQIGTTLVPHPCFREQPTSISPLKDTDTEINIFSKTHLRKSSQRFIYLSPYPHIKTTGIEFIHFFFPPRIPPVVKTKSWHNLLLSVYW